MKKSDLKRILKPIVKECINEALIEQGLLSNIISEVVRGLQPIHTQPSVSTPNNKVVFQQKQRRLKEQKRKLLDAAGFGTDVFAGTEPIHDGITTESKDHSGGKAGALAGVAPSDPGVDIAGIMALGGRNWGKMI